MEPLNHEQARKYIHAAADHLLATREVGQLNEHLASCIDCRLYAEEIATTETKLRDLFRKQSATTAVREINLIPGIRTRYQKRMIWNQFLSIASTWVTIALVVGALILLNWFLANRQPRQPAGASTPTPSLSALPPATVTASPTIPIQLASEPIKSVPENEQPSGFLVFTSSYEELGDLYLIHADGSGLTQLFDDQRSLSLHPAWAPDGKTIAFVSTRDGNSEIYILSADGKKLTRLTDHPSEDTDPAWSPDGRQIAFASDRSGYSEIYILDTSRLSLVRLTNTQASNKHPTWSPDGAYIAFSTNRDGYWQIYIMKSDGMEQNNISNDPSSDDREPAWSPDGKQIAFASQKINELDHEISVMNSDGTQRMLLTDNSASDGKPGDDYEPTWSPNGLWIAFCSNRDNTAYGDIYILHFANIKDKVTHGTTTDIRLTTKGGSQPTWKP